MIGVLIAGIDQGYAGTINYNCPSSGGTATVISEDCTPDAYTPKRTISRDAY